MQFQQVSGKAEVLMRSGAAGKLYLSDGAALSSEYAGQAQCVYIDPPFNTGESFVFKMRVGEKAWAGSGGKIIELPAYNDSFLSTEDYLNLLRRLIRAAYQLLSDTGAFFLHLDGRSASYARLLCDEVFGAENFVNEIIWAYQSGGRTMRRFSKKHDNILFYQKSKKLYFNIQQIPISRTENRDNHMKKQVDEQGRSYRTIKSGGKTYIYYDDEPVYPGDVWTDVSHLQQKDPQRTGYDTQKPIALLNRIIRCCTRPGDLVVDLCCGSGTTLCAAAELDRRYLGADISRSALGVCRKRLMDTRLQMYWPFTQNGAALEADMIPGIGFYDVHLYSYTPPQGTMPQGVEGLDAVDQWAVGFYKDGIFQTQDTFVRQKKTPRLNTILLLPQLRGVPAIMVIDVMGNTSIWISKEDI